MQEDGPRFVARRGTMDDQVRCCRTALDANGTKSSIARVPVCVYRHGNPGNFPVLPNRLDLSLDFARDLWYTLYNQFGWHYEAYRTVCLSPSHLRRDK